MANELRKLGWQRMDVLVDEHGEEGVLDMVCGMVSDGESLSDVSKVEGVPYSVMWRWLGGKPERMAAYKAALEARADKEAHETLRIADGAGVDDVQVAKLRVEARKWVASKWGNAQYGDKLQVQQQAVPVLNIVIGVPEMLPQMVVPKVIEGDVVKDDDLVI